MFSVRILSGPTAGQKMTLKPGRNVIGRGAQCDIQLQSPGISKEHCELHVFNDRVVLKDLNSSNGTFLNGVKIQTGILRSGDKFGVYDLVMELLPLAKTQPLVPTSTSPLPPTNGNVALQTSAQSFNQPRGQAAPQALGNIQHKFEYYVYDVALPGVYKLAEIMPLKQVLALFVFLFIFCVTFLSVLPMMRVTQESIMSESRRRALSIARTIAQANQQAFLNGSYAALSTQSADVEEGVKQAFIVQQSDGLIVAPAIKAGRTSDLPFVHKVRNENKSFAEMIDSDTLAASFPIGQYDPNTGEPAVKAHAIVLYDVGSMALDSGRVISLFMQTFLIAMVFGAILFFFMYQLIENPIRLLNFQLDQAMREKRESIEIDIQFPALQALIGNMSSLLSRAFNPVQNVNAGTTGSKDTDMERMLYLVDEPMVILRGNETILGASVKFAQLARTDAQSLKDQAVTVIQDGSLQQNITYLVKKTRDMPYSIHEDQLEFSGHLCAIKCSAVSDQGLPAYFIITITPKGAE